jgi:hypothetical protein
MALMLKLIINTVMIAIVIKSEEFPKNCVRLPCFYPAELHFLGIRAGICAA